MQDGAYISTKPTMKVVVGFLVFCSFTGAILLDDGIPVTELEEQEWPKDEAADAALFVSKTASNLVEDDDDEEFRQKDSEMESNPESSQGLGNGDEMLLVGELVSSLHSIIPVIQQLNSKTEAKGQENAEEFMDKLKHEPRNDEVKETLGNHVRLMSERCVRTQFKFLEVANHSGLFGTINTAINESSEDNFDAADIMLKVQDAAEKDDYGMFNRIDEIIHKQGGQKRSELQAFSGLTKLLTHAACDQNLDGLLAQIEEILKEEQPEGEGVTLEIKEKILPFVYKKNACKDGFLGNSSQPALGLRQRILHLLLDVEAPCVDVPAVKFGIHTVLMAKRLFERVAFLKELGKTREIKLAKTIEFLIKRNKTDEADNLLGNVVLKDIRRALLVALTVHQRLGHQRAEPTKNPDSGTKPTETPTSTEKPSGTPVSIQQQATGGPATTEQATGGPLALLDESDFVR